MSARVCLAPSAIEDIVAGSVYYRTEGGSSLGERFEAGVAASLRWLSIAPEGGSTYGGERPELASMRWIRVKGFERHLVFYRVVGERVEVVRVVHGARDLDEVLDPPG